MKVKFRGGPFHNKTKEVKQLKFFQHIMVAVHLPIRYEDINNSSHTITTRQHKYQLGKDEKDRKVYFHIGCI